MMRIDIPHSVSVQNPAWSPDGTRLCLTDWRGGYNRAPAFVLIYNLTTKNVERIATRGTNCSQPGSCWHPQAGIIFSSDRWGDDGDQVARWSDNNIERMTFEAGHVAYEPSWSPNGFEFVFERHVQDDEEHGSIVIGDRCSQASRTLTDPSRDCRQPNWSAQDLIVYQEHVDNVQWLHVVEPDGKNDRRFTRGTDATWHPDGRLLYSDEDGQLALLKTCPLMTCTPVGPRFGYHGAPSVSPDGRRIACEACDQDPDTLPHGKGSWLEIFDL